MVSNLEAIVLAGGFGTRLSKVINSVTKPMAPVSNKPFLTYILDDMIGKGINNIVIAVCYKKESIIDYFQDTYNGATIQYSIENTPLLTGGAIKKAMSYCVNDNIFVINGDTFFDLNFKDMCYCHDNRENGITMAVKKMDKFSRYGSVCIADDNKIVAFNEKAYMEEGYINGGIYLVRKGLLQNYPDKFSMENDCLPNLVKENGVFAFKSDGFFIDIGIPEDYEYAQRCFGSK